MLVGPTPDDRIDWAVVNPWADATILYDEDGNISGLDGTVRRNFNGEQKASYTTQVRSSSLTQKSALLKFLQGHGMTSSVPPLEKTHCLCSVFHSILLEFIEVIRVRQAITSACRMMRATASFHMLLSQNPIALAQTNWEAFFQGPLMTAVSYRAQK